MSTAGKALITSQTSAVLKRVYELLKPDGDLSTPGEWFVHEKILEEASKVITPSQAIRFADQERMAMARKEGRTQGPRVKNADNYDVQVAAGQRGITRQRIWGSAHIEFRLNDEGVKEIRFAPGMGRQTKSGQRSRRNSGISKKNIPYKYRTEETSVRSGDAREHDAVPRADAAADPQPEGG